MRRPDWLASQIVSGEVGIAPRTSWWPRHVFTMAKYFSARGKPRGIVSAREAVLEQAREWDCWMPEPARKGLMDTHAALELELVDATLNRDAKEVDRVGTLLIENAVHQGEILRVTMESFPEDRFRRLLEEHVSLFAAGMRLAIERRNDRSVQRRAEANSLSLAGLTVEWF